MTDALSSFGTLVKMGDGATPETFATVAELLDIKLPNWKLNTEDATNHSSPNAWGEKIATIKEGDDLTFQIQYVPSDATHDASSGLLSHIDAADLVNFKVVLPDVGQTTWSFSAFVTAFGATAAVRGKLTADVGLSISGQPTLA